VAGGAVIPTFVRLARFSGPFDRGDALHRGDGSEQPRPSRASGVYIDW
jgi:hypothetical protein